MGIFSFLSKQLFHREFRVKDKRSITYMDNNGSVAAVVGTTHTKNVKEGYEYKYNDEGRRYHANEDAAYMMPNDNDGTL
jgi:hypothetical protein